LLIFLFALALGMAAVKELGLYLQNWPTSIFSPQPPKTSSFNSKTFCPCLARPTSKSQLSHFSLSAFAVCTSVFSTLNYVYLACHLKNTSRTQQSAFLVSMSYVTQVHIFATFPVD